jgi:hypothetical protein
MQYAGAYNSNFDPVAVTPAMLFEGAPGYTAGTILQIDVFVQASGLTNTTGAKQDLKQAAFDLLSGAGALTASPHFAAQDFGAGNWNGDTAGATYDPPGPTAAHFVPYFSSNGDAGQSSNDLLGVMPVLNPEASFAFGIGEGTPLKVGSIYMTWDGQNAPLTVAASPPGGSSWVIYTNNTGAGSSVLSLPSSDVTGATLNFLAPIPEPATMTLLVLGGLGMLARRRNA